MLNEKNTVIHRLKIVSIMSGARNKFSRSSNAIVLVVIVKVHSLEDKRTLRDSRRILISSFLEEPLKSS